MKMSKVEAALIGVVSCFTLGCLTVLMYKGVDTSALTGFILTVVGFFTAGNSLLTRRDTAKIQRQTNGHMTALLAKNGIPPVSEGNSNDGVATDGN